MENNKKCITFYNVKKNRLLKTIDLSNVNEAFLKKYSFLAENKEKKDITPISIFGDTAPNTSQKMKSFLPNIKKRRLFFNYYRKEDIESKSINSMNQTDYKNRDNSHKKFDNQKENHECDNKLSLAFKTFNSSIISNIYKGRNISRFVFPNNKSIINKVTDSPKKNINNFSERKIKNHTSKIGKVNKNGKNKISIYKCIALLQAMKLYFLRKYFDIFKNNISNIAKKKLLKYDKNYLNFQNYQPNFTESNQNKRRYSPIENRSELSKKSLELDKKEKQIYKRKSIIEKLNTEMRKSNIPSNEANNINPNIYSIKKRKINFDEVYHKKTNNTKSEFNSFPSSMKKEKSFQKVFNPKPKKYLYDDIENIKNIEEKNFNHKKGNLILIKNINTKDERLFLNINYIPIISKKTRNKYENKNLRISKISNLIFIGNKTNYTNYFYKTSTVFPNKLSCIREENEVDSTLHDRKNFNLKTDRILDKENKRNKNFMVGRIIKMFYK